MSASRTSSGVRNLRSVFENHNTDSASPPPRSTSSRGRSPTNSEGVVSNDSKSPRPLSKVRTNFVAVERNGEMGAQLGLKKSNGSDSTAEKRRSSFSLNEAQDPQALAEVRKTISGEREMRRKSTAITETVPEVAVETPSLEPQENDAMKGKGALSTSPDTGAVLPAEAIPSGNPDKPVSSIEEPAAKLRPADPTHEAVVSRGKALPKSINKAIDASDTKPTVKPKASTDFLSGSAARPKIKQAPEHGILPPSPSKLPGKPKELPSPGRSVKSARNPDSRQSLAPINVPQAKETAQAKGLPKPTAKSPKTPTTPTTSATSKSSTSKTTPARSAPKATAAPLPSVNKSSRPSLAPQAAPKPVVSNTQQGRHPTNAPSSSSSAAKKPPTHSSSTFSKPRRKSPTRPVRLPSSATAPTASSVAKTFPTANGSANPSRSPSRASNTANNAASSAHAQSSTSNRIKPSSSRATGSTASSSLHRKPSRASMPAPRSSGGTFHTDRPRSRASDASSLGVHREAAAAPPPDGGFLARMMRPTASTASKAHDKGGMETRPESRGSVGTAHSKRTAGTSAVASPTASEGAKQKGRGRISGDSISSRHDTQPDIPEEVQDQDQKGREEEGGKVQHPLAGKEEEEEEEQVVVVSAQAPDEKEKKAQYPEKEKEKEKEKEENGHHVEEKKEDENPQRPEMHEDGRPGKQEIKADHNEKKEEVGTTGAEDDAKKQEINHSTETAVSDTEADGPGVKTSDIPSPLEEGQSPSSTQEPQEAHAQGQAKEQVESLVTET
ncbi:MAG: hypothetical protein M1837_002384 [Sclerophora amabilis]|nr:MAG: hypothetical protein M1837_002384 [Sclerophora amabilis]